MNCLSVMKTINSIISTLHEKLKDSLCGLVGERAIEIAYEIVKLLLVRLVSLKFLMNMPWGL